MKKLMYSIAAIIFIALHLTACDDGPSGQEPAATVDFQYLAGYWALNNYETHTKSNNNTMIVNTRLDGSLGIDFGADGSLQILQRDTLQSYGDYTIYEDAKKIKLSELTLAEGVEPTGTAKVLFPIISNNTVEVDELVENKMIITVAYDANNDIVAYFTKQ